MSSLSNETGPRKGMKDQIIDLATSLMPSFLKQAILADDRTARIAESKEGQDAMEEALSKLKTHTAALEREIDANNLEVQTQTKAFRAGLASGNIDQQRKAQMKVGLAQMGKEALFTQLEILTHELATHVNRQLTGATASILGEIGTALARANSNLDVEVLRADSKGGEKSGKSKQQELDAFLQDKLNQIRGQGYGLTQSSAGYQPDPAMLELAHSQEQRELVEAEQRAVQIQAANLGTPQASPSGISFINQTAKQMFGGQQ